MRRIIPVLALILLMIPAIPAWSAEVPVFVPVKEKSSLKFFAIQNGAAVEGRFTDFTADIHFDAEQLDKSSIKVEVNTGSVAMGHEEAQTTIKLPDWLSVEKFPKAVFKSKSITRMPGSDNYYTDGTLTLRGKSIPATINFQLKAAGDGWIATGFTTLKRGDFAIGQGEWAKHDVIKNEVRVEFRLLTERK